MSSRALEIAAQDVAGVRIAQDAGTDRVGLCVALTPPGGLTSPGLLRVGGLLRSARGFAPVTVRLA